MPTLTYYGHSCVQLSDSQYTLLIDPFLTNNPRAPIRASQIERCNYILVTHGHADHVGDTVALASRHGSTVIATWELANFFQQKGVTVHPMSTGGAFNFPFGRVKMTPAFHGCGGDELLDGTTPPPNTPVGYLITIGGRTVYHAGDTALFSDMKLIGETAKIDMACVPIGDNFTMGVDDAARAIGFLDAERAMPIHFDTWDVIAADTRVFEFKIKKQNKRCVILEPGQAIEI